MKKLLKTLNYQPVALTESQLENPWPSIINFYDNCPLHQARAQLWEMYKSWCYYAAQMPDEDELKDMLCFYGQLTDMVNLWYVMVRREEKES